MVSLSKLKQSLHYQKDSTQSAFVPPVAPFDIKFHKGRRPEVGNTETFANEKQDALSKTLKAYTVGQVNANTLRTQLLENNVQIDP